MPCRVAPDDVQKYCEIPTYLGLKGSYSAWTYQFPYL